MRKIPHMPTAAQFVSLQRGGQVPASMEPGFHGIVGVSPQMREVFVRVERIAPFYRTVLISGDTGTGKELVAHLIHRLSPARDGQLVTLNCSAVVETLFESELFGHVRGAFTGALTDKMGLLEFAHGGTLFLDEIGDMPASTQAKLLRAVQNQEVLRVGSLSPRKVEVRIIAATNKDLREAVRAKEFREDLYYRLSTVEVALPPLRDRVGDLPGLIRHALGTWSERIRRRVDGISEDAMELLASHAWPGNVRELENVIGHACMMGTGSEIKAGDLPQYLSEELSNQAEFEEPLSLPEVLSPRASDALEEYEYRLVRQALRQAGQNQTHAARLLGTTRDRLRYKMKKFGLAGESIRPEAACA